MPVFQLSSFHHFVSAARPVVRTSILWPDRCQLHSTGSATATGLRPWRGSTYEGATARSITHISSQNYQDLKAWPRLLFLQVLLIAPLISPHTPSPRVQNISHCLFKTLPGSPTALVRHQGLLSSHLLCWARISTANTALIVEDIHFSSLRNR